MPSQRESGTFFGSKSGGSNVPYTLKRRSAVSFGKHERTNRAWSIHNDDPFSFNPQRNPVSQPTTALERGPRLARLNTGPFDSHSTKPVEVIGRQDTRTSLRSPHVTFQDPAPLPQRSSTTAHRKPTRTHTMYPPTRGGQYVAYSKPAKPNTPTHHQGFLPPQARPEVVRPMQSVTSFANRMGAEIFGDGAALPPSAPKKRVSRFLEDQTGFM